MQYKGWSNVSLRHGVDIHLKFLILSLLATLPKAAVKLLDPSGHHFLLGRGQFALRID